VSSPPNVRLRDVEDGDLAILFRQQADPVATAMANFPAREWAPFLAHWTAIRAVKTGVARAIVADGALVGHIVSWLQDDHREVGYWIGREFWGRGYATRALALLLEEVTDRPLVAHVVDGNIGSRRVLEHCGFVRVGGAEADGVRESIFRLD
jgi:RimJ/RimL family protein N-acetyltransferase